MKPDRPLLVRDARPDRPPHLAGHLAVQLADAVDRAGGAQRERGHVEQRAAAVVVVPERQEGVAIAAERAPGAGQVGLDQVEGERVVTGGDRRVRREHRRAAHFLERRLERVPLFDHVANPLEHDERGMPLVEVPDLRHGAERLEGAHAADAEDDLLLDARLTVAAVEARGQLAVPRRVLFEVGVEQVERHTAEADPPDRHQHAAVAERHGDDDRLPVGAEGRLDGRVGPVQALVDFLLPAFRGHRLVEVALRIHEPDADQRNPEVARFLAVVAGEHAEAAGVDGQRLVQRELRGEVAERSLALGEPVLPPRVVGAARAVERLDRGRRRSPGTARPARPARASPPTPAAA